jgi:hypothetical protein
VSWEICVDPEILGGKPVIKGTRIPVELIFELAGVGYSITQIIEEYPYLTPDTHTMNFVKSTTGWGSDVGARWYADSGQSSPGWLTVLDWGAPS